MDGTLFIHDVKEKETGAVKPPSFPQPKSTTTGFPEHKKRTRVSAFKQKRHAEARTSGGDPNTPTLIVQPEPRLGARPPAANLEAEEKRSIDRENRDALASMSPDQIEEARQELFNGLDPAIVQMLLRRANLDESTSPSPFDEPSNETNKAAQAQPVESAPTIKVEDASMADTFDDTAPASDIKASEEKTIPKAPKKVSFVEDDEPSTPPTDASQPPPLPSTDDLPPTNTTHFPQPKPLPDLDPADPDFLETLHSKFFPSLPADPSKLAWMAPLPTPDSVADRDSPYYPGQDSLPVSALRFDFRGALLPPRVSRAIPVSKGLHHHGEAPEAAGYTVPELGRLARSAVPAQRCIAFQTLGRILYRLGRGEFGPGDGTLAMGLWRCAKENRVLDSLLEAADVPEGQGHRGSRAYAIEALWLFEKGGWKEKWRGR
ncbi:RNA polymerase II-associated protein RBA50 [Pleurostoma richardsiae]|uniref:RNA polymerase II-associated protein RBA50 n=1 Tax=Pleurostoma richardsiae TaxID=41990 RepID=A0AA38RID0_9PEZI|nr:RNA polymerase II-associated protein RBA50 [Pleurostoma richardsiae]